MKRKRQQAEAPAPAASAPAAPVPPDTFRVGQLELTRLIGSERVVEPIELLRLQDGEATETEAAQLRAMVRSVDWMEPEFSAAGGKLRVASQMLVIKTPGGKQLAVGGASPPIMAAFDSAGFKLDEIDFHIRLDPPEESKKAGANNFPKAKVVDVLKSTSTIVDEGGAAAIICEPASGHTDQSLSVVLKSLASQAVIIGGAILHPTQLHSLNVRGAADFDYVAAIDTRTKLLDRVADSDTLLVCTNFASPSRGLVLLDREKISDYKLDAAAVEEGTAARR